MNEKPSYNKLAAGYTLFKQLESVQKEFEQLVWGISRMLGIKPSQVQDVLHKANRRFCFRVK